jgi:hypothetical protein
MSEYEWTREAIEGLERAYEEKCTIQGFEARVRVYEDRDGGIAVARITIIRAADHHHIRKEKC